MTGSDEDISLEPRNLEQQLAPLRERVEQRLGESLDSIADVDGVRPPPKLLEAMRYSLLGKGKRLRPLLVLHSARAVMADASDDEAFDRAWPAALAVEYIHAYSLIHDDLPALDDDELRRGRPTVHRAFDEATAILAGDALLTDAFTFVASAPHRAAEQVRELALAAGSAGMVGGQAIDMMSQGRDVTSVDVDDIHRRKTGRLFIGSCVLGGLAGGATDAQIVQLREFGAAFGLAFQIMDDVLDVIGDADARGKAQGGDAERDKATSVAALGLDAAHQRVSTVSDRAEAAARALGAKGDVLEALAHSCAERTR